MKGGCSGGQSFFWRKVFGGSPPWEGCCLRHDELYAKGGTKAARREADWLLHECVMKGGHPTWANIMWLAVRVGGWPFWPTSFRWGFERPYWTGYDNP